jgi:hypothetical protein
MACFDALPSKVRAAVRECDFYLDILCSIRGLNPDAMVERIKAVQSFEDGRRFMKEFGRRGY